MGERGEVRKKSKKKLVFLGDMTPLSILPNTGTGESIAFEIIIADVNDILTSLSAKLLSHIHLFHIQGSSMRSESKRNFCKWVSNFPLLSFYMVAKWFPFGPQNDAWLTKSLRKKQKSTISRTMLA